jgi:seryl-tRNA synthetase
LKNHRKADIAKTKLIRNAAKSSIGSKMPAKSLELKYTFRLISEMDSKIQEVESAIQHIMDEINSPILTLPGIS